jgi:1,4-dihydroxy-2-naphthoyl-CoA synthase
LYAQLDLGQADAYRLAGDVMARSSQTPDAQESMQAFLEKRAPRYQG